MEKQEMEKRMGQFVADENGYHLSRLIDNDEVHGGFTFAQLNGTFDLIKDRTDWKNPISVKIPAQYTDVVIASIEFFTATTPIVYCDGEYRVVESEGYRRGPAGDH
jgi:hypothetical protein